MLAEGHTPVPSGNRRSSLLSESALGVPAPELRPRSRGTSHAAPIGHGPERRASNASDMNSKCRDLTHAEHQKFRRLFDTFDVDQSGYLEFDELQFMLRCLGVCIETEQMEQLKEEVDEDENGTLDFEEFVTFMLRSDELKPMRLVSEEEEQLHIVSSQSRRFSGGATWRWCWDVMILLITSYFLLRVVLEWYQPTKVNPYFITLEIILTMILVADVFVYGNTAYLDSTGRPVEDLQVIVKQYAMTFFPLDVLGAFPFDLLLLGVWSDYPTVVAWRVFRALRLLRIQRVLATLFNGTSVSGLLRPRFVFLQFSISPVLTSLFYFVMFVHLLTVGWLLVVSRDDYPYYDGLYLVLYTLTTVGYGDMQVDGQSQKLYCCMLFLGGALVNGIVISQMSVFLQKADIKTERKDKMRETLAVLTHFDIPEATQSEILSFQNHVLEHNLGTSHEELVSSLPETIQESLGLFMKIKYISMVPMFVAASHECKIALATSLVNIVFHPQDFIIIAGERGKEMYFLGHGVADVLHPTGTFLATLRKGQFFGEIALLVEEANRTASIKALTYCDVFRLEKRNFSIILRKFPTFQESVQQIMEDRVKQFQQGSVVPARRKKQAVESPKDEDKEPRPVASSPAASIGNPHSGDEHTPKSTGGNRARSAHHQTRLSLKSMGASDLNHSVTEHHKAEHHKQEPVIQVSDTIKSAIMRHQHDTMAKLPHNRTQSVVVHDLLQPQNSHGTQRSLNALADAQDRESNGGGRSRSASYLTHRSESATLQVLAERLANLERRMSTSSTGEAVLPSDAIPVLPPGSVGSPRRSNANTGREQPFSTLPPDSSPDLMSPKRAPPASIASVFQDSDETSSNPEETSPRAGSP